MAAEPPKQTDGRGGKNEAKTVVNTPGSEASHVPSCVVPKDIMLPPGQRIATTMEIRSQIAEIMNRRDYHPIRELVDMVQAKKPLLDETGKVMKNPDGSDKMVFVYDAEFRKSVHAELAPYIAPKLKAVDMQVASAQEITITVVKFGDRKKDENMKMADRVVDV